MAGRAAVRFALQGATDQMVTLLRGKDKGYSCSTGLAPLQEVAGRVQRMPAEYLDAANEMVTTAFMLYAKPLIGPSLPRFNRLP